MNFVPLAGIAQLVERVIRNDEVVGSIPISGTSLLKRPRSNSAAFFFLPGRFYPP